MSNYDLGKYIKLKCNYRFPNIVDQEYRLIIYRASKCPGHVEDTGNINANNKPELEEDANNELTVGEDKNNEFTVGEKTNRVPEAEIHVVEKQQQGGHFSYEDLSSKGPSYPFDENSLDEEEIELVITETKSRELQRLGETDDTFSQVLKIFKKEQIISFDSWRTTCYISK